MKTGISKHLAVVALLLIGFTLSGNAQSSELIEIHKLIKQKDFFKAMEYYKQKREAIPTGYGLVIEATLDNAFNNLEASDRKIAELMKKTYLIPDSLMLQLYRLKEDNAVKLFKYKEAKEAVSIILDQYKPLVDENEISDLENNNKIWTALENEPPQHVIINNDNRIKIKKDKAGLNNLSVVVANDSLDFVFDTGANISTTIKSIAQKLNMKIIPSDIQVGSITGIKVNAQLAVCKELKINNIIVKNAIFLVFDDKDMAFPQIDYQIYGIIGFPIISAMKEIQITHDGYFIVPQTETTLFGDSNMALNGLTPLIYIDGKHYTFDTGADSSMLYHPYYIENKIEIDKNHKIEPISFGGAGGHKQFDGFKIDAVFNILGKEVILNNIDLLKEPLGDKQKVYGNIGQDFIQKFEKMTLNFSKMFIKFD
ncbi:retropepsin-like aspartic protease [Mariniflexile litorale]|uniref:Retropepsin-like aspartic protease n=1 Tax=Mariniflexile litorale TaxID=3045158 RepID=A0AAU7EBM5_9FLAO|nr:retropepsin-like aspartic protease [Mariniflexile sp. KMM 9835]MDQ8213018.1 retropepsin-like aspartic protease [Mariniflexile sp. KMM 9835]